MHVIAVAFAAFSLRLSTKPAAPTFLYGYERITFFSAGFEGAMIIVAAVWMLVETVETLARELARKGVTLNVVCPGPTDTPLFDNFRAASPSIGDALARGDCCVIAFASQ